MPAKVKKPSFSPSTELNSCPPSEGLNTLKPVFKRMAIFLQMTKTNMDRLSRTNEE